MKKSEMIQKIKNHLECYDLDLDDEELEDEAYCLLYLVEKAGMLPPGHMKPITVEPDGHQYPLVPGDFQNEQGVWCTPGVKEWEKE